MTDAEKKLSRIRRIWKWMVRIYNKVAVWLQRFNPGPGTRKGAVVGAFSTVLLLAMYSSAEELRTGLGWIIDALIGLIVGAVTIGFIWLAIVLGLTIALKLPKWFTGALVASLVVVLNTIFPGDMFLIAVAFLFCTAAIGGSIAVMRASGFSGARKGKRIAVPTLMGISVAGIVIFFVWVGSRGTEEGLTKVAEPVHGPVVRIDASDPAASGPYPVLTLTYGSGEDRRAEFGEEANLITESVDAKHFVGKLSGWKGKLRNRYWGFDRRAFSLNGRVWYPEGEGSFPLVLCVHGNHSMREYSDPGYEYLGEHLASRGYIFVSVDENFLNGDWTDTYGTESDARGWVLLEHLKVWRGWNAEEGHLFQGKADMDRIALIGHSRGGEAVAVAASFNRLPRYPDDASLEFDFDFNIRGIIGIAPVDGQYTPADQRTPLENINYLLLHGSHDGDVSNFSADRQYKRLEFNDGKYWFKTSIYVYRANHGQFNTVWGDSDWGMPGGYFLNRKEFITGEEQRQVAKVYIGAFLDAIMKDRREYLPLFRDFRTGEHWLPETYYINRFEDSETRYIADFDEDIDVTTATVAGSTIHGEGLADWKERDLRFRGNRGNRGNQVVYLGWRPDEDEESDEELAEDTDEGPGEQPEDEQEEELVDGEPAFYSITLPEELGSQWSVSAASILVFSMAEPDASPSKPDTSTTDEKPKRKDRKKEKEAEEEAKEETEEEAEEEEEEDKPREPLDLTIELEDTSGRKAAIPLSEVMRLLPPLEAKFTRYGPMEDGYRSSSEATLQTIEIPLSLFADVNRQFDLRGIRTIRFVFDRSEKGVILLDEVGFRQPAGFDH